jgi:O-methyltransferase
MRRVARQVLGAVAAMLYHDRPLGFWPRWAGDALEVKVPRNVPPKPELSAAGGSNINIILSLLERTREVPGDLAECGVFRGASLCAIALYLVENGLDRQIFALDSFHGFDRSIDHDLKLGGEADTEKRIGGFDRTSFDHVSRKLARLGLAGKVTLLPGYFAQTLSILPETRYSFVHLDCDIYESYKQTLTYFYPRMASRGIILLDEYNDPPWPGCNLAVDEFLVDKMETLSTITRDNYRKYYIEKHPDADVPDV